MHYGVLVNTCNPGPQEAHLLLAPYDENSENEESVETIITSADLSRFADIVQDFPALEPVKEALLHRGLHANPSSASILKKYGFDFYYFGLIEAHLKDPDAFPIADMFDVDRLIERLDDLHGETYIITASGDIGYTFYGNPNAKWDWWSIGGRWGNYLHIKDGFASEEGEMWGTNVIDVTGELRADWARVDVIDFESMEQSYIARYTEYFNEYLNAAAPVLDALDNQNWKVLEPMREQEIDALRLSNNIWSLQRAEKMEALSLERYAIERVNSLANHHRLTRWDLPVVRMEDVRTVEKYFEMYPWGFSLHAYIDTLGEWHEEPLDHTELDSETYITVADLHN